MQRSMSNSCLLLISKVNWSKANKIPVMTYESRRSSDPKIDQILEYQRNHIADYHGNLEPGEALRYIEKVDKLENTNARILTILDGKKVLNASGETTRVGGMSKDVADMKRSMNGGKLSIKTRDKAIVGLIAATPSLIMLIDTLTRVRS